MTRQNTPSVYRRILKQWPLYLMMVPGLAYLLINNYMPLAGLQLAFKKFKYALGIWKSDFNNFKNFTYLFKSSDAWIIIRNTVGYNLVFILLGTVVAIFVAILLNMVRVKRMQKFYQTVILIPHLISYVIVSYIVYAFLLPALKNKDPLNNTVSEPLPHIPGMAPVGDAVPASEWKNEKWRSSEDETISFALEDDQVRLRQCKKGIERVFFIGLHGKWLENPSHLWTSAHFSIDTGVYGIPDEPCWFSGAWMTPYRFEMIGKSLGEMGEYRYAFELIKGELEIQYTPQMQHNVSSLLDCEKMRGEAMR